MENVYLLAENMLSQCILVMKINLICIYQYNSCVNMISDL